MRTAYSRRARRAARARARRGLATPWARLRSRSRPPRPTPGCRASSTITSTVASRPATSLSRPASPYITSSRALGSRARAGAPATHVTAGAAADGAIDREKDGVSAGVDQPGAQPQPAARRRPLLHRLRLGHARGPAQQQPHARVGARAPPAPVALRSRSANSRRRPRPPAPPARPRARSSVRTRRPRARAAGSASRGRGRRRP